MNVLMTPFEKGKIPTEANSTRAVFDNIARSEIAERVCSTTLAYRPIFSKDTKKLSIPR